MISLTLAISVLYLPKIGGINELWTGMDHTERKRPADKLLPNQIAQNKVDKSPLLYIKLWPAMHTYGECVGGNMYDNQRISVQFVMYKIRISRIHHMIAIYIVWTMVER